MYAVRILINCEKTITKRYLISLIHNSLSHKNIKKHSKIVFNSVNNKWTCKSWCNIM